MMINIYGGYNLIAPVASSAIQNFYGDRGDEAADQPEDSEKTESTESVTDEKPAQEPAELSDDEFYVSAPPPPPPAPRAPPPPPPAWLTRYFWESVPRHANWRWW